jgi:hypothetical protein
MPVNYNGRTFRSGYMATAVFYGATAFGSLSFSASTGLYTFTPPTLPVTGGFEVPVIMWSNGGGDATLIPIINSVSGRQPLKDVTQVDEKQISIDMDHDFAVGSGIGNPFLPGNVGMIAGASLQNVVLFLSQTKRSGLDGQYWYYSSIIVKSTPQKAEVKGQIALSLKAEANGPWFPPGVLVG